MRYLRLGPNGEEISCIGLGTIGAGSRETATGESIQKRIETLEFGLDQGVNFFDTGEDYEGGYAEEVLGILVKKHRNKIFLATKFAPQNSKYSQVISSLEGSLKRLNTEFIDLYQLHWPNKDVSFEETMGALRNLLQAGKIRYVGVSNCSIRMIREAQKYLDPFPIVSNQIKINLINQPTAVEPDYFKDAKELGILNLGYGVFAQGNLRISENQKTFLGELCRKYGLSQYQLFLLWVLSCPDTLALVRSMSYLHLKENLSINSLSLEYEDLITLSNLFSQKKENIAINLIEVLQHDADISHKIYTSLDEAIANKFQIQPNIHAIAAEIQDGEPFRPVEVIKKNRGYELVQGRMRFWAWQLLYGRDCSIPSIVLYEE